MASPKVVAVVTGASRGIGLAICQKLAATTTTPLVLFATSRSGANLGIRPANDAVSIKYSPLDITKPSSVKALVARVQKENGACDVLINNAGLYHYTDNPTPEQRREMIDVNYRGTLKMCQAFLPIMKPGGRIVNVSSASGNLQQFRTTLQSRFRNPNLTLADVEALAQEYENASKKGNATKEGWARRTYFVSKALETAMTIALSRDYQGYYINACCPGWVSTDLGNQAGKPPKTVEDGAKIPIRVGFGDIGGVTGKYWANDDIGGKGEGKVQKW